MVSRPYLQVSASTAEQERDSNDHEICPKPYFYPYQRYWKAKQDAKPYKGVPQGAILVPSCLIFSYTTY